MAKEIKVWSWRDGIVKSGLKPTTRHVLLTLSIHINEAGVSTFPTTRLLAEETGLSERAVITHLQLAVDQGWLERRQYQHKGQAWAGYHYDPCFPEGFELTQKKGTERRSSVTPEPQCNAKAAAIDFPQEGTEPRSVPFHAASAKVLNDVQCNSPSEFPSHPARAAHTHEAALSPESHTLPQADGSIAEASTESLAAVGAASAEVARQGVQEAASADTPPAVSDAEKVVDAFDTLVEEVYGTARGKVRADDLPAAVGMLQAGATVELCREVFASSLRWMHKEKKPAPAGVCFFRHSVGKAILRPAAGVGKGQEVEPMDIYPPSGSPFAGEWGKVREEMLRRQGKNIFRCWIQPLTVGQVRDGVVELVAPSPFIADKLSDLHRREMLGLWRQVMPGCRGVSVAYHAPP